MDWLANTISAMSNNIYALLLFLVLIIVILISLSTGLIHIQFPFLKAGKDVVSNETRVKQLQWDYLIAETEIALRQLPQEYLTDQKKWRTHYVVGKYRDVLQLAIINNNIIDDEEYIESKQILCYSAIVKATTDDFFKSEDFRESNYKLTERIIKQFYKIKKKYV